MRILRRTVRAAALMAVLFTAACSDAMGPPREELSGVLTVEFTGPAAGGALRLVLEGPGIAELKPERADMLVFARSEGERHEVAVIGPVAQGAVLRFSVPDAGAIQNYSVTLVELASLDTNELQADLERYTVSVAR